MSITTHCVKHLNEAVSKIELKPRDPFEMNTIIYQNAGVRDLLTFELTQRLGVTANLNFKTLQQWMNQLASSLGHESTQKPLVWKILSILKNLNTDKSPVLAAYLNDELRAVQLAEKLAGFFDDYESYHFNELTGWQKEVRAQLSTDDFQSGAVEYIKANRDKITENSEVTIIGLDFITPLQFEFLNCLKNKLEVKIYFVYPSNKKHEATSGYWQLKHKMLRSLEDLGEVNYCEESHKQSVLSCLQAEVETEQAVDESVQIANAYSKKREVQELYNFILYQCQFKDIKPYDVQVLCPNIEAYQPYIDAIFTSDDFPVKLPYHIADVPSAGFSHKIDLILKSLSLGSSVTLKEVSNYLENRQIQKKYQIHDYATAIEYLKRTAFIVGDEQDQENDLSLIGWPQAKKRLIYGLTMASNEVYDGVRPFDEADGQSALQIMGVINLIEDLFSWSKKHDTQTFNEWFELFAERYHSFHGSDDEEFSPEDHAIWPLFDGLYDATNQISAQTFQYIVGNQIAQYSKNKKRFINGITVSELSSNRGIARKVTCIVGLNDQSFPRKEVEVEIDLLKGKGLRPLKKEVDKLDYVSAIQSAQDILYLSYVGTNTKNNTILLPSIFLSETVECVKKITGIEDKEFIKKHPADVSAAIYTNKGNGLFTFFIDKKPVQHEDPQTQPQEEPKTQTVFILEELINYYTNPAKWYYNNILNISLFDKDESLAENESFGVDNLQKYAIRDQFLKTTEAEQDTLITQDKQNLQLPLGGYGDALFSVETARILPLKNVLQEKQQQDQKVELDTHDLQLDGIEIIGGNKTYWQNNEFNYLPFWCTKPLNEKSDKHEQFAKAIIKMSFTGAYLAGQGVSNKVYYYYCLKNGEVHYDIFDFSDSNRAKEWLKKMVELYEQQPRERPIHFYPKVYWRKINEQDAPVSDLNDHFEDAGGRNYPDKYQYSAFFKSMEDYGEDQHQNNVMQDWELYSAFWKILS